MYIDSIELENIRTFEKKTRIEFVHPDKAFRENGEESSKSVPRPVLDNVNLLFGDNAAGKTTLLEAIAIAALGPTATDSRISPRPLVRFNPEKPSTKPKISLRKWDARIKADLLLHGDERVSDKNNSERLGVFELRVRTRGELESFSIYEQRDRGAAVNWDRAYQSDNDLFFIVAYGSTRRVDPKAVHEESMRERSGFRRANRVESVMLEGYPLIPFENWFPDRRSGKKKQAEIIGLINSLLGKNNFSFSGSRRGDDFLYSMGGLDIPSKSLSDGYRIFLGWVADLLFHLDFASRGRNGGELTDIRGVVLVDEIDLHLHPKWQMSVIATVAKTFPKLQFIFTSHSPLIAGSVEWMNIVHLRLGNQHRTVVDQFEESIHGLDADQILVSSLFGLESTRAQPKQKQLHDLTIRARRGDDEAAKQLISEMAKGLEAKK